MRCTIKEEKIRDALEDRISNFIYLRIEIRGVACLLLRLCKILLRILEEESNVLR